jgi:hypothetical protein
MIHFANAKKSKRLSKLLKAFIDYKQRTTAQLQAITKSMATHTDISELRANGYDIRCNYSHVDAKTGHKIYIYNFLGIK